VQAKLKHIALGIYCYPDASPALTKRTVTFVNIIVGTLIEVGLGKCEADL